MHYYLAKMLEIYEPNKVDWMNFDVTSSNPYSYHHIEKREDGGKSRVENGAILSKYSHRFLHFLEYVCPDAFEDFQRLFRRINDSKAPRTEQFINEADIIIDNLMNGGYQFLVNIDSSEIDNYLMCGYLQLRGESKTLKKIVK